MAPKCPMYLERSSASTRSRHDYDDKGLALLDEFSDAIVACVKNAEYSDMQVISVTSF
jgi:hypothetical protein